MSSKNYNRKASRFVISNPDASATDGQRAQISRLLRFKSHDVKFGNLVVEIIDSPNFTRGEADRCIKHLAGCPTVKRTTAPEARKVAEKAIGQVRSAKLPTGAQIDWESMVKSGKLGKVAAKRALAVA